MKKLVSLAISALLTLGAGADGVAAIQNNQTEYACVIQTCSQTQEHLHSVCPTNGCTQPANHEHDGILYNAHHENDGHDHTSKMDASSVSSESSAEAYSCGVSGCTQIKQHGHLLCDLSDCIETANHEHDGSIYYGHGNADSHSHHQENIVSSIQTKKDTTISTESYNCEVSGCNNTTQHNHTACTVSGCNQMTNHEHNGMIYFSHKINDDHVYNDCGLSGCTRTVSHSHNSSHNSIENHKSGHNGGKHH